MVARGALRRAIARAERLDLVDRSQLSTLPCRHQGRPGCALLEEVLASHRAPLFTRSEAEERFLDLVRRGGLPDPESNVPIRGFEVDFLWRATGMAVEVDGFGFHGSRRSFENDRRRDAELAAAGVHVIRVTWRQIVDEPMETLVRVAQALALAGTARHAKL